MRPPELFPRFSNTPSCCPAAAAAEPHPGLLFASWFSSLLKDSSAVHHVWCRALCLPEPWHCHMEPHHSPRKNRQSPEMVLLHHLPLHETSCGTGRICPWGESSLIHNLACTVPNLLFFSCAPGLVVSQLSFFNHCLTGESEAIITEWLSLHACCHVDGSAFLWSVQMLAITKILPSQSQKVQAKQWNPHLRFSFVNKYS